MSDRKSLTLQSILAVMSDGKKWTPTYIGLEHEIPYKSASAHVCPKLKAARQLGFVKRSGNGEYQITEAGRKAIESK